MVLHSAVGYLVCLSGDKDQSHRRRRLVPNFLGNSVYWPDTDSTNSNVTVTWLWAMEVTSYRH